MDTRPLLPVSFGLLALIIGGCQQSGSAARAYQMQDLTEGVGGPKAMAQPGDFVLENEHLRFAVLAGRPSMGPHTSGGSLVDADLNRADPRFGAGQGNDQLAELFSTVNLNVTSADELSDPGEGDPGEVVILADGSDGGAAVVCVEGPEVSFISLLDLLWPIVGAPEFRIKTHYILEPGARALLIRSWAVFDGSAGCDTELESQPIPGSTENLPIVDWALQGGVAMGDFYLQGGDVDVFVPDVGFDETGFFYEVTSSGVNTFTDPIPADFLAGTAEDVSYALMPAEGLMWVPMFTSSQTVGVGGGLSADDLEALPPGTALHYDRWLAVGRGDVGSAVDALLATRGDATGRVEGHVVEATTGVALSDVNVFARRPGSTAPWTQWETDVGEDPDPDGSFGGSLPPGDWEIFVHAEGRPLGEVVSITVAEGSTTRLVLESPQPGSVSFEVRDETGRTLPAKITFFSTGSEDVRQYVLGDSFIGDRPAEVAFSTSGQGQVVLPDGEYYAVASRGLEYELDISEPFQVDSGRSTHLELTVRRSVETTGWISADFHVHAQPSHDSGVSLAERVATMTAEGVEFMSSTDHDYVTNYAPVVEQLGMEEWLQTAIGLETTTIEVGHFLGFPLRWDDLKDNGGALDWTGLSPEEILTGIRELGVPGGTEPVVFVGHPRDGILGYFDEYGVNTYEGEPGVGGEPGELSVNPKIAGVIENPNELLREDLFSTDYDAIEVLNGKRLELIRTPTQAEMDAFAATGDTELIYDWITRTMDEQEALEDGTLTLGYGTEGTLDDWFALLNLGHRPTLLGNSDTHGTTGTESGCPRNYVWSDTDDPGFISEAEITRAVKEGRVVASYGPFVRFYVETEAQGPGTELVGTGPVPFTIEVQSPSWMDVSRVELYENGTLLAEWTMETPNPDILNFAETVELEPDEDSWYVVVVTGPTDLSPVFSTVEIPYIQLEDIVNDALSEVPGVGTLLGEPVPIPRAYPVFPYAVTNPIFVDLDGDGFDAPGHPDWWVEPEEPEEETAR